ncbi:MAG TPA: 7-cyano-7-deazaguanine synthase QueC [Gammaproteobacteria bacterium]|jgi:7-cyano-7-deazaguanine synthase|nr:7-cyano-7-deazaguanine synthase QueC [Gammaproteobacteria bacterium]
MNKKAVVLLSGGLDSATCLAMATAQGFQCYALSFIYDQKNIAELTCAKYLARQFNVIEHKILTLPLGEIRGSSLTDVNLAVPDHDHHAKTDIPNTYVPARNTIFLSFALAWGEILTAYDIFIGANFVDYAGYPDCRPEYFQAFTHLAKQATKAGAMGETFTIQTPLLYLHKAEIIREGLRLGVDYSQTVSCYRATPQGEACGNCDSCAYRKKGFGEAGVADPTRYRL